MQTGASELVSDIFRHRVARERTRGNNGDLSLGDRGHLFFDYFDIGICAYLFGNIIRKLNSVHGKSGACGDARCVGCLENKREQMPHLFFKQTDRICNAVRAKRIRANKLGK